VLSQSEQQITHVDTKTGGPLLRRLLLLPVGPINALLLNVDENRDLHAKGTSACVLRVPPSVKGPLKNMPQAHVRPSVGLVWNANQDSLHEGEIQNGADVKGFPVQPLLISLVEYHFLRD